MTSAPPDPTTDEAPAGGSAARPGWLAVALPGAVVLIFVAAGVALSRRSWSPQFDFATMELNVRDVGSHTPLVGPYSRYGWFHPGPLLYFLLAIPYRVLGSDPIALAIGAALLNGAAFAAIVWVALRRGGAVLGVLTVVATSVLSIAMGSNLVDPWGPYITVLPLILLVFVAWSASCGEAAWCLPVGVVLGTFLVQTHVGYAPVVLALGAWIVAWWVVELRRRGPDAERTDGRRLWWGAAVAVGAASLLWAPVAWEALRDGGGNLTALWDYFTARSASAGAATGWDLVARQLTIPAPWLGAAEDLAPLTVVLAPRAGGFPIALAAFALASGAAVIRRDPVWRLDAVVALCIPAAWFAMASIQGPLVAYLARWTWAVGMLTWLATAWTAWCLVRGRLPRPAGRALTVIGAGAAGVALVALGVVLLDARPSVDEPDDPTPALAREVAERMRDDPRPIFVRGEGEYPAGEAMMLQLERAGRRVVTKPFPPKKFGAHRLYDGTSDVISVLVAQGTGTDGRPRVDQLLEETDFELLAETDPLGRAERRRLARALKRLAEAPDDEEAQQIVTRYWGRPIEHVGVFLLPRPDADVPPRAVNR